MAINIRKLPQVGSAVEWLQGVREILTPEENWCQGAYYRDRSGNEVKRMSPMTCQACLYGAMDLFDCPEVCYGLLQFHLNCAIQELYPKLHCYGIEYFNDHEETTHQDVLAVLDRAIKLAQESEA